MLVLCPSCHNTIDLPRLVPEQEIHCPACGSTFRLEGASTEGLPPTPPWRISRFEVVRVLGQGAFGTVYQARDPDLERTVALKVPREANLSGMQLDRFLREARSVAQLRHPAIVSIHEVGQADGLPFLVSDFIQGITLADLLSARRPSPRDAAALLVVLAQALHFAHEHGVVHRDVKPSNVMIDEKGQPHLMDFGMARRAEGEPTMTQEGQVLGTPAYMSPEQARGEAHRVDGRSDVYSLGVILYQMLTGELPFRGTQRMLLHQVLHDDPRPPRRLNEAIPRDLETICLRAMAREPGRRYPSAGELAADLQRFLDGEPIHARPIGRLERAWVWARRRPGIAALSGAVIAISLVAFALVTWQWREAVLARQDADLRRQDAETARGIAANRATREEQARKEETRARHAEESERIKAQKARVAEAEQRRRAEDKAHALSLTLAHREWSEGNIAQTLKRLTSIDPARRGWEWKFLRRLCSTELMTLTGHKSEVLCVAFSPDGAKLVSGSRDRTVRIWDAATGAVLRVYQGHREDVTGVAFHPDGKRIASAGSYDGTVHLWDVATGRRQARIVTGRKAAKRLAFSPDGTLLAVTDTDAGFTLWDVKTARKLHDLRAGVTNLDNEIAFHPDGTQVAFASAGITVWNARTGQKVHTFPGDIAVFGGAAAAFLADGRLLGDTGQALHIWDMTSGREVALLPRHPGPGAVHLACGPEGRWIAVSHSDRHSILLWDLAQGAQRMVLRGHTHFIQQMAFASDGARLASASSDGTIKVWDLTRHPVDLTFPPSGAIVDRIVFSPDGQRVAMTGTDSLKADGYSVRIASPSTGETLQTLRGHTKLLCWVDYNADGTRLVSAGDDCTVRLWDGRTGKALLTFRGHAPPPAVPPGQIVLRAGGTGVNTATFLADGQRILSGAWDGTLLVWDSATGKVERTLKEHEHGVRQVAVTADGKYAASIDRGGRVIVWDARTFQIVHRLGGHTSGWSIAFRADGRVLATGGRLGDGTIRVWEMPSGKLLRVLEGHVGMVSSLAFSPDGRRLVSCGGTPGNLGVQSPGPGSSVKVWDPDTGQELLELTDLRWMVMSATFHRDGHLAVSSFDGFRIWKVTDITPETFLRRRKEWQANLFAWQYRQAALANGDRRWFTAAYYLDRLIEKAPDAMQLRSHRLDVCAEMGRWDRVEAEYNDVLARGIDNPELRFCQALARLAAGNHKGYVRTASTAFARWGKSASHEESNTALWTCALADGVAEPTRLVAQAEANVKRLPARSPERYQYANTLAALLYRAGRYEEALLRFKEALALHGKGGTAGDWVFLAMLYHRRGMPAEARRWLARLAAELDRKADPTEELSPTHRPTPWMYRTQLRLLRGEAETLCAPRSGEPRTQ